MKKLLLAVGLLFSLNSVAQNNYLLTAPDGYNGIIEVLIGADPTSYHVLKFRDTSSIIINTDSVMVNDLNPVFTNRFTNFYVDIDENGLLGVRTIDSLKKRIPFSALISKPTTLSGYGITDAYPLLGNPSGFLTSFTEVDGSVSNEIELPSQTGNSGKYLTTNGSAVSWATVTTTNPGATNGAIYSAGTVYSLTTTMQKVDFGTTDPAITIPAAGTYLIYTNVKLAYNGLLSATNKTVTLKLRRTNNTAADLSNSTTTFVTPVVALSALNGTAGDCDIPALIYTTSNNNDSIELWGNISAAITGSMDIQEASIVIVKIN